MGHTLRPSWASVSRSASHPRHTKTWGPFNIVQRLHSQGNTSSLGAFFTSTLFFGDLGRCVLEKFGTKLCEPSRFFGQGEDRTEHDRQKVRQQCLHFKCDNEAGFRQFTTEHLFLPLRVNSRLMLSVVTADCPGRDAKQGKLRGWCPGGG